MFHFEMATWQDICGKIINLFEILPIEFVKGLGLGLGFMIGAYISLWLIIRIFFGK